ncbi:relaxase domain-containing protein [Nocardia otitidiscaviarum]|uniref:MobF family relaxase n=1 Tax=Nocardia TaxID=1817 RepID=UPI00130E933E|nr:MULTISPECIES: MobF family relaxase [Nocardia]MBF6137238.1 relaxase domain-containing protein [Nocardia otitidiscaviarum]MBF6181842.1 relaxase domain-containing protein [Nocardia otitidiscaviarum]MBF6488135.1 relaxase domain-containing protein [Nocardia otitidiscaviarum]
MGNVFLEFTFRAIFEEVMTLHRLHAGDGYEYLTRQVASGDRLRDRTRDLTDYYTEHGTPPGVWMGRGARALGLSGNVTEAQMQALFGEGLHPDADAIIAAAIAEGKTAKQAVEAAQIGRIFYEYSTEPSPIRNIFDRKVDEFTLTQRCRPDWDERTILRTDAAREHLATTLGRVPDRAEIAEALAAEKVRTRKAVAGFDCVFTPQKSISILWGLGSDAVRREIWQCHLEAVTEVLEYAESRYAVTRRGANGVRQIDATGLIIAAFTHYDNRAGDMNPHTHAVISGKVLGSDGEWSALDARALYAAAVSLSCRYNATIVGKLKRRMGWRFEERTRGRGKLPVLEVVGVTEAMVAEFSRRDDILARFEQLAAHYRDTHGHNPKLTTQYKLAQQATLETRQHKPLPTTLRHMIAEWGVRFRAVFGHRSGQEFVDRLHWEHTHPDAPRPFDPNETAAAVGVDLGGIAALPAAAPAQLEYAINSQLDRCLFDSPQARTAARAQVVARLVPEPEQAVLDRIDEICAVHKRSVYDPAVIAVEVTEIVGRRRPTWTEANIASVVEDRLAVCDFASDQAHRDAVAHVTALVRDRHSIQLSIDPDPVPAAVARASGESIFTTTGSIRYTSPAVLDAETRLLKAARTPVRGQLSAPVVDKAIKRVEARESCHLNPGQRAIARYLCTVDTRLAVAIGPAGTGKTTAMKAVAEAWQAAGRTVIPLAPSASAARELGASLHAPARTLHKLFAQITFGVPTGLTPDTMLLIDEAAMAATFDLDKLLTVATSHGAIIRCIGDPEQLSAVESGGIIRTIARDLRAPQLRQVVRFDDPNEAEATLAVRAGDAKTAWEFYHDHGRITHGMSDQLRTAILTAHLADTAAGISSVMIAATLNDVSALNTATQAAHINTGRVRTDGGRIPLSDGHCGFPGDIVVTRANNPHLKIIGGRRHGTQVDNGDLWRIRRVHTDGSITVTGTSHRGSVLLPPDYISEHVELGYATTVHRAQGITVRRAYLLLNATLGRALAYVGLTRGSELNRLYLATDALVDISGDQQPDDPQEPLRCFARVLAREDDNRSAIDIMRAEQAAADRRIHASYQHAHQLLADARAEYLLDRALPVMYFHDAKQSPTYRDLLDTIALADAHHFDTAELVASIATNNYDDLGESLATARDTAAVLRARADRWIRHRLPTTTPNPLVIAPHETLTATDEHALFALVGQANTGPSPTLATQPRFRALRDLSSARQCPPVPTPWPGIDVQLADYAHELRRRVLARATTTTPVTDPLARSRETSAVTTPMGEETPTLNGTLTATAMPDTETLCDVSAYDAACLIADLNAHETLALSSAAPVGTEPPTPGSAVSPDRLDRMRADYHSYVKELADSHTDRCLYRALPAVLYRLATQSRHWTPLLDTIALAGAHQLDTSSLIAAIATDNYNDLGASLLLTDDPARELRDRADGWILQHLPDPRSTDQARFRALNDWPYSGQFRPIPNYPGRDELLADFADELRQRIERARSLNRTAAPSTTTTPAPPSPAPAPKRTTTSGRRRVKSATPGANHRRHRRGL